MRKPSAVAAGLLSVVEAAAAAQHAGDGSPWGFLLFTLVLLVGLVLLIYYRVQESGFLTFLPPTTAETEETEEA